MDARKRVIEYIRRGDGRPRVSLQVGAGAGFDTKLAGKLWNSETTIEDTIRAYEIVGGDPLYNIGLPAFDDVVPQLKWQDSTESKADSRFTERLLDTPYGTLRWRLHEIPKTGITPIVYPTGADDVHAFDKVDWYAEQQLKGCKYICELLAPLVKKLQSHGPVSVQWNLQPFELFGLASVDNLVVLGKIDPERYRKTCDNITAINIELLKEVFRAGADFVFLGGPGVEMMSPEYYHRYIIPDSKKISKAAHEAGGLIYSHICSPIEPFLTMGFYNEMGIDLFETLSSPPVGNVESLAKARSILNKDICTRGNIGLDVLLTGDVADVEKATLKVLEDTRGYKHYVAASDYLFYDIPLENVKAVVRAVELYAK